MKLVVAIIQPIRLTAVQEALRKIDVERMTVCDALGYGRQGGQSPMFRGHEYKTQLLRKVLLEIAVNDDFVEVVIETISNAARSLPDGEIGDGKILVVPIGDCVQISDNSRGPQAI